VNILLEHKPFILVVSPLQLRYIFIMNKILLFLASIFLLNVANAQNVLNPEEIRVKKNTVLGFDSSQKKYQWELKVFKYAGMDTGLYMRTNTGSGVNYWKIGGKPEIVGSRSGSGVTVTRVRGTHADSILLTNTASAVWGGLTGTLSDQTDLQAALDAKSATSHTHVQADVTGLVAALAAKEPLITAGTTSQYRRGDNTWQTLDKTAVGLSLVTNTPALYLQNTNTTGSDLLRQTDDSTISVRRIRFGAGFDTTGSTADAIIVIGTGSTVAWGAITGTLSSQSDLQTALNAKQATLVSATNIKTINGNSILGAGDITISGSVAWGNVTGTIGDQTDLASALSGKASSSHTHAQSDITSLVSDLAGKQALLSSNSSTIDFNGVGVQNFIPIVNVQTGTTYTIQASDNGKIVTLNNSSAITVTYPSSLATGFNCMIVQLGAGQVTVSPSGVTLQNADSHTKLLKQLAYASLIEHAANTVLFVGQTSN
jgi:hypothetical protein